MALVPNSPIYAPFEPFINGLGMAYATTTTLTINNGQASDSTIINVIDIAYYTLDANGNPILSEPIGVTINCAQNGANGLDTGALANNTLYAVFAIGDSTDKQPAAGLMSLSPAAPYLPYGYDMFRRVGYVLTDGSAHILKFDQASYNNAADRAMWYDANISVLSGGSSATYAAVSLAACVPAEATTVIFQAAITPTAASNGVNLRPTGSSSTNGYAALSGSVASVAQAAQIECPCNATPSIDYKVTGAVSLLVAAYVDQL